MKKSVERTGVARLNRNKYSKQPGRPDFMGKLYFMLEINE